MLFKVVRFLSNHPNFHRSTNINFQCIRTFVDDVEIKFIRDRGLDHAVEKEKDLKPMVNLKNLIKSEPSKSLPLSSIVESKDKLGIPFRPIEFIRKYPSIFEEYFPGNIRVHPHVRLTPEILNLDAEEQLIYDSDTFKKGAADRLLKLLMLCRVNEIPLKLIDMLKWDLGLPDNYVATLVPEFPDYFQVKKIKNSNDGLLELVCWSHELAVSVMEKKAMTGKLGYMKGMPLSFHMQFSRGFKMDKKLKKWINEWQKLPYISPYQDASHFQPNSDESDKWAVSVLHEFLHILVPKKTERDNLLCFGEYLGIRSRFKRALIHHPGIFYLSSKIGTYTVVLREGYKRGLSIENHPLMDMRKKYVHLMHTVKEVQKLKSVPGSGTSKQQAVKEAGDNEKQQGDGVKEQDVGMQFSGSDDEDESDDNDEEEENSNSPRDKRGNRRSGASTAKLGRRKPRRAARQERSPRGHAVKT